MKKFFRIILIFTLCFSMGGNVFAASSSSGQAKEEKIENEIKKEIRIARNEIYRQLEQQDALILMNVYEDIIYPQIEQQIRAEYEQDNKSLRATSASYYYAPNGGFVSYLSPVSGYKPTEVACTCLNRDDSYDYILKTESSFSIKDLITTALGYAPFNIGAASSSVMNVSSVCNKFAKKKIYDAGGCLKMINTYSRQWGTKASLLTGWSDRYNIYVPAYATNVTFKAF